MVLCHQCGGSGSNRCAALAPGGRWVRRRTSRDPSSVTAACVSFCRLVWLEARISIIYVEEHAEDKPLSKGVDVDAETRRNTDLQHKRTALQEKDKKQAENEAEGLFCEGLKEQTSSLGSSFPSDTSKY